MYFPLVLRPTLPKLKPETFINHKILLMKNSKLFSQILPLLCFMLMGSLAFGQANKLTIVNSTDCHFELVISAMDCDEGCTLGPICIGPGTTIVNTCGSVDLEWDHADVVAVDANCETCGGGSGTVQRVNGHGCGSAVTISPSFLACDPCGTITVTFSSATQIDIF